MALPIDSSARKSLESSLVPTLMNVLKEKSTRILLRLLQKVLTECDEEVPDTEVLVNFVNS